jgi:hypothetical protein
MNQVNLCLTSGACKFLCVTDLGVVSNEETTDEPEEEDEEQS